MMNSGSGGGTQTFLSFGNKITNSITSSLGCPSLGALGLSFSSIYNMFHKPQDETTTDIKDYSLQTSTYNRIIPEVFGKVRLAGNLMWVSEIKKTSVYHPAKQTKTGTTTAYTDYYVRGSFAVAICKGVVDKITNIYADGEPLNLSTYNIKIYLGTDNQNADPTMQSYLGNSIPAFRGLCYVVFTNFPMEEFNNRIPNFTFDVVRKQELSSEYDIENMLTAVTIIPGSGENVYDTKTQKKLGGIFVDDNFFETSKSTIMNNHTDNKGTDAVESLDDLVATFPKLKWVSLVVSWFCDSLDCGEANIYPACEFNNSKTYPDDWEVAGIKRKNARVITMESDGSLRYGGTPSDVSIKRFAKEIKKRGLKLCIYPMLMVDTNQKPWRGHITGNAGDVSNFFTKSNGYNAFIKHYATMLKDDLDAIIIGSEMVKLTSIYDQTNTTKANAYGYPAVKQFCNLANEVRSIIGSGKIITYAADWSEYHHDDRGCYNLDALWSHNNIDVISIDAYFPLTNDKTSCYDINKIISGWRSGEGYDYYYTNNERTETGELSPQWAWKNVEYFWSNKHTNQDGTTTDWVPKSKKIWFTEYGFPSVDCCSNQPNVFYSKNSFDSAFPRFSQGIPDFKAQRIAIAGTEKAWLNSECVVNKFCYTWDARPYPSYPNLTDVWCDCYAWKYGHWLNGKAGSTTLGNLVSYLCRLAGLKENEFDTSLLEDELLNGYVIDNKSTILNHIKILADAFNFDAFSTDGKIYFKSLKNTNTHTLTQKDLVFNNEKNSPIFNVEQTAIKNAPSSVEVLFIDVNKNYTTSTAIAKDDSRETYAYSISIPMPLNLTQAQQIAWRILSNLSTQTTKYDFQISQLAMEKNNIEPLDNISINVFGVQHLIRIMSIKRINKSILQIQGHSIIENENIKTDIDYSESEISTKKPTTSLIPTTNFELFELYNIKNDCDIDTFSIHCAVWSNDENWNGCNLHYSTDSGKNYKMLGVVNQESCVGTLLSITGNADVSIVLDTETKIEISLMNEDGKLQSIDDEEFSKLTNIILIGNEVIAFRDVEQLTENTFRISHLLRGRFNTADYITNHTVGERVILLDDDIKTIDIPMTQKGKTIMIKAVSMNDTLLNSEAKSIKTNAKSTKNYDCNDCEITSMLNQDIRISFNFGYVYKIVGSKKYNTEIVNSLQVYAYIYDNNNSLIRKLTITGGRNYVYYTTSMMRVDFGKIVGVNDIKVKVGS